MLLPVVLTALGLLGPAAATTPPFNLSDPAAIEEYRRQWMQSVERVPTEALVRCPVSCSIAGRDTGAWDLYPDAARMAVCNETVLFTTMINLERSPFRVWYVGLPCFFMFIYLTRFHLVRESLTNCFRVQHGGS